MMTESEDPDPDPDREREVTPTMEEIFSGLVPHELRSDEPCVVEDEDEPYIVRGYN